MIDLKLNRRHFLAGAAGAALVASMPSLGFAAAPKSGGTLRAGLSGGSTADSLDPATFAAGPIVYSMMGAVCNSLTEIDADGNAKPELAESIEPSADAKSWTFKLRKGVTFSSGKELTAKDVIASYNHHRGKDTKSGAKSLLEQIVDIRADGSHTVVFDLKDGNADFPFVTADYHLIIMQAKDDGSLDWQSGIGTGGYVLDNHEPGVRIKLKRRDDYWKEGRAWFDEVEIIHINDPTARQNSLATGEVDLIDRVDTKTVHLLKRFPGVEILEVTGTAHYTMPMFTDVAPFNNRDVRLALKHGIDREDLVRKVLRGHGSVGNDHPIGPSQRFYAKGLEQRVFDPEKAKFHLKKAGMSGLDVDLSTANAAFTGAVDTAVLFKESASKAGINVNVIREPDDGYWSNVWLKKPFCFSYWNGRPTEDWMFSLVYAKGADWNDAHWENERFNELLLKARSELDDSKRRAMYEEMQMICRDDAGTIIPMFANFIDARTQKLAHGKLASNSALDGWKFIERWWSAA
ncbi:MAG: ABC transporter substrate-binding protein [Cohaesibacter sp.]|jgi:peptide/nickel transport system substrate-binding protein|nr:ABC transporter substrate-binding protein [Cohaesibacter sp.]